MDFRRQNDDEEDEETVSYNPPTIRDSAFPKPLLPSSSSLIPGRSVATSGVAGVRNGIRSDQTSGSVQNASQDLFPANEGGKGEGSNFRTAEIAGESSSVKYRECLKNHAASLGGNILDGCGEFMPSLADIMKCAACGCHRSFHRREGGESDNLFYRHHHHNGSNNSSGSRGAAGGRIPLLLPAPQLTPHQKHIHTFSSSPSAGMVGLGNTSGGTTTESSSEELGLTMTAVARGGHMPYVTSSSKKRFRTKFTSEQKARMMNFAERIGWRIQRQDEAEMETFCTEVGVSRQVFKVWMHNNKHSIRKQQEQQHP
ncbi:zinc-finger homeodomain protein 5-like [Dendrobium catenatum]|uniref:ZF-HD dimerization-type domain-containing protein n=2 Tax=Dendrobium TaxID=37818 RepID=A0A8T3BZE1_DENNO|nr:zinc-finger homeodomain protein 5-like [Dendrobium catenatum]KAI0522376.1 hypothetical protein KFK09_004755 [Dendrobium nobile]PKU64177.1 ZF-HD homeobox protein [Dendrobium catenatum]